MIQNKEKCYGLTDELGDSRPSLLFFQVNDPHMLRHVV